MDWENGATRMLANATIRMQIPLAPNITLVSDPTARSVVVNRGIPSTLNTPALDPHDRSHLQSGSRPRTRHRGLERPDSETERVQDPNAVGRRKNSTVLPRQFRESLEDVLRHYQTFFRIVTQLPDGSVLIDLTDQNMADAVAYMKLLR
jgi:hypothetical protein